LRPGSRTSERSARAAEEVTPRRRPRSGGRLGGRSQRSSDN
jgi:hypothetical protein